MSPNAGSIDSKTDDPENKNALAIHCIAESDRSQFNADEIIAVVGCSLSNLGEEQSDWNGYFDELESY